MTDKPKKPTTTVCQWLWIVLFSINVASLFFPDAKYNVERYGEILFFIGNSRDVLRSAT
jgi:hypothetical protein